MAAVSTVMQALLKSGDHIVSVNDVYGGVNRFFRKVASGFNISVTLVDATNTSNVENAIKDNTKVRERGGRERRRLNIVVGFKKIYNTLIVLNQ